MNYLQFLAKAMMRYSMVLCKLRFEIHQFLFIVLLDRPTFFYVATSQGASLLIKTTSKRSRYVTISEASQSYQR